MSKHHTETPKHRSTETFFWLPQESFRGSVIPGFGVMLLLTIIGDLLDGCLERPSLERHVDAFAGLQG